MRVPENVASPGAVIMLHAVCLLLFIAQFVFISRVRSQTLTKNRSDATLRLLTHTSNVEHSVIQMCTANKIVF
jgi:hypothetical protein